MNAAQFRAAGRLLFVEFTADGFGASGLADMLGISLRSAQKLGAGEAEIPPGIEEEVLAAVKAAILRPEVAAAQVIVAALSGELLTAR